MEDLRNQPKHLAWHETLELHELTAMQSTALMNLKKCIKEINDKQLRSIYAETIKELETNLKELLRYYSLAQREDIDLEVRDVGTGFYAGELLIFAKTAVRSYATAITETATPMLRETFTNHLLKAIKTHAKIFNYMYEKGLYPAYNLEKLLQNDIKNAKKALEMRDSDRSEQSKTTDLAEQTEADIATELSE